MTNRKPLTTAQMRAIDEMYLNHGWIGSQDIHHATAGALQTLGLIRVQDRYPSGGARYTLTDDGRRLAKMRHDDAKEAKRLQDIVTERDAAPTRTEIHTFDAANPAPFDETREVARAMIGLGISGVWIKSCPAHASCTISAPIPKGVTPDDHREALTSLAQAVIRTVEGRIAREVIEPPNPARKMGKAQHLEMLQSWAESKIDQAVQARGLDVGMHAWHEGEWRQIDYVHTEGEIVRVGFVGGGFKRYASISMVAYK